MTGLWPQTYRSAVLITVNVDAERALLTMDPALEGRTKTLSTAAYGMRRGVDAITAELDRVGVPATWLLPGSVARAHPDTVRRLAARPADAFGIRGDDLEPLQVLPSPRRRAILGRAVASLRDAGIEPTGFRLPRGDWPHGLVADLAELGIGWSSSFVAEDLPFALPGDGGRSIVELPFHYAAHDRQAFEWNFAPAIPAGHSRIASYDETLENWLWEFAATREEGLLWVLTLHPEVIGTPGRIGLLREVLDEILGHADVWAANAASIASWWRSRDVPADPAHPAAVFLAESGWPNF